MNVKDGKIKNLLRCTLIMLLVCVMQSTAFAEDAKTRVGGHVYEFNQKSHYDVEDSISQQNATENNTYGEFLIESEKAKVSNKNGIPSYEVESGEVSLFYNYDETLLQAGEDEWHLTDDKNKKIGKFETTEPIKKGAILVLSSIDRKNWIPEKIITNAFEEKNVKKKPIYVSTEMQLLNGCYYRVVVAYKMGIRTKDRNVPFINADQYDFKKCLELYEFYAAREIKEEPDFDPDKTYACGKRVRVKKDSGYAEVEAIDKNDLHKGWDLGNFFVSGYTESIPEKDGNVVFLKNAGDKVTLWFHLKHDLDCLEGNKNKSVSIDEEGYDQYFEQGPMNFGRGALFIRYTDRNNNASEVVPYINYLQANTRVNANTRVQLFEEGDYEVALDYKLTDRHLLDKDGYYRIFFKFSVRNGNCMIYPFDLGNGSELANNSMTESGFRLDLAKSQYMQINLKREILKKGAEQLTEDTRFNGPAKSGAEYTDEGIYTITARNDYTGQTTVKKIYVGSNNIMHAHIKNNLSIQEINKLLSRGASISASGDIIFSEATPEPQNTPLPTEEVEVIPVTATPEVIEKQEPDTQETAVPETLEKTWNPLAMILGITVVLAGVCAVWLYVVKGKQEFLKKAKGEEHK